MPARNRKGDINTGGGKVLCLDSSSKSGAWKGLAEGSWGQRPGDLAPTTGTQASR